MATYILKSNTSDITDGATFSRELSGGTEAAGSITVELSAGASETNIGVTREVIPNNDDWDTGDVTVEVNVTTSNADFQISFRVHRINSAGSIQESSTVSTTYGMGSTGVISHTFSSLGWTAGNCSDRLRIDYIFENTAGHGGSSAVDIETGTTDAEVITAITENGGSCDASYVQDLEQWEADHDTVISVGGETTDGETTNIYLDKLVRHIDNQAQLTPKVEVEETGTAFGDTATASGDFVVPKEGNLMNIRRSHSVAYDSKRERIILFGGWDGSTQFNDVWEMTLPSKVNPVPQIRKLDPSGTLPGARRTHVLEYDSTNDRLIMFGGYDGADLGDTWELDFSTSRDGVWNELSFGTSPDARAQPASTIDNSAGVMYLVCGWGASRFNDVWELDLTSGSESWSQIIANDASPSPERRSDPAVIHDSENGRLILFGGDDGTNKHNDVWEVDLSSPAWNELTPSGTAPAIRTLHSGDYDSVNGRMIVFGGENDSTLGLDDYFELDLTSGSEAWTEHTEEHGYTFAGMTKIKGAYSPESEVMIIWGGQDSSDFESRYPILFDTSDSADITQHGVNTNRYTWGRDAMAYATDDGENETIMMGGYAFVDDDNIDNGEHVSDIWIHDQANDDWYPVVRDSLNGMLPREGTVACFDSSRDRFLLFGGLTGNNTVDNTCFNDVYELKKGTDGRYRLKRLETTGTRPAVRWLSHVVYDTVNDRMVIFGGHDSETDTYLNDTWELDFSSSEAGAWNELSPTGTAPTAVRQAGYFYDSDNNRMYIINGEDSGSYTQQTLYLDLTSGSEAWNTVSNGPASRRSFFMRYDSSIGLAIGFGGYDGSHYSDTWTYDPSTDTWTELSPSTSPTARRSHNIGIDRTNKKLYIAFGRADTAATFNTRDDTWVLDYSDANSGNWDWSQVATKTWVHASTDVTGLTASGTDYHWQGWASDGSGNDSAKTSFGGNAESEADFTVGTSSGTAYTQSLTDSVVMADSIAMQPQRSFIENLVMADSVATAFTSSREFNEAIVLADTITRQTQTVLSDALTLVDQISRQIQKAINEAVTLTDRIAKSLTASRSFTEAVTVVDTITNQTTRALSEVISLAATITNSKTYNRAFSEFTSLADTVSRSTQTARTETISLVDTISRQATRVLSDSIFAADRIAAQTSRSFQEVVTLTDNLARSASSLLTENITLQDVVDTTLSAFKTLSEQITASDSLNIGKTLSRAYQETISLVDTIKQQISRSFSDALTLADTVTNQIQRSLIEVIMLSDTIDTGKDETTTLTETVTLADAIANRTSAAYQEVMNLADSLQTKAQKVLSETTNLVDMIQFQTTRAFSEVVTLAAAVSTTLTSSRAFSESIALIDSIQNRTDRAITETINLVDNLATTLTSTRTFQEVISLADQISFRTQRVFTEALNLVDSVVTSLTASRAFTETVSLVDSINRAITKTINDAMTLTDRVDPTITLTRTFSEVISIVDSISRKAQAVRTEVINVTDTIATAFAGTRTFKEDISLTDTVKRAAQTTLTDTLAIVDSVTRQAQVIRTETLAIADRIRRQVTRSFSEVVSATATFTSQVQRTLKESANLADTFESTFSLSKAFTEVVGILDGISFHTDKILTETINLSDSIRRQTDRVLSDAVTAADTIATTTSRSFSEVVTAADTISRAIHKTLTDSTALIDTIDIAKSLARSFSDSLSLADTIEKVTQLARAESVALTDTISRISDKVLAETLSVVDTVRRSVNRTIIESLSLVDALTTDTSGQKTLTDTLTVEDTVSRTTMKVITNSLALVDDVFRRVTRSFTEITGLTDTFNVQKTFTRAFSDSLAVIDSVASQISAKVLRETVNATDSISKMIQTVRSESLELFDDFITRSSESAVFTEAIQLADSFGRVFEKLLSEAVTVTDMIASVFDTAGDVFKTILKSVSDGPTILGTDNPDSYTIADDEDDDTTHLPSG